MLVNTCNDSYVAVLLSKLANRVGYVLNTGTLDKGNSGIETPKRTDFAFQSESKNISQCSLGPRLKN